MKRNEISETGIITQSGGLSMYMGALNDFFKKHIGERIIARFTVAPVGSSEALKGYYFHYVVPTIRHALWETGERKSEEQTELFLRKMSPLCYEVIVDVETGEYTNRLREIRELSNAELIEHIDLLRQFAAEDLHTFIDDPKTL